MNKTEIMSALEALKQAGMEFTSRFNHLADVIEAMANEHEKLLGVIHEHETTINRKNDRIAELNKDNAETYARATKAEGEGWHLTQSNTRLKVQIEGHETSLKSLGETMLKQHEELEQLRPFRDKMAGLQLDVSQRDNEIAELRLEISKLHEVILNVATSVDKIVNPPAKPQVGEVPSHTAYHDGGMPAYEQAQSGINHPPY